MIVVVSLTLALTGALVAALLLVAICVRVEERRGLPYKPPNGIARAVRMLCGLHVCQPSPVSLSHRPTSTRRPA